MQQENLREVNAVILREALVRLNGLPLVARATGIPMYLPAKTTVKLAVTEVDPEKQLVGLSHINAVI